MKEGNRGDLYTLAALIALYQFEPSLRDVYVEGRTDAGVLSWYFMETDIEALVFPIDDRVQIPQQLVDELRLDTGARGRAIALAVHCERELGKGQQVVAVVVDADFARITGPMQIEHSCLLMTDGPALEHYALADRPLTKLLRVSLRLPEQVLASDVREAILPALRDIYAARQVLQSYNIRCVDDVGAVCHLVGGDSRADIGELIRRSLTRVARGEWPADVPELVESAVVIRGWIEGAFQSGRGHDIAVLLVKYLGLRGPMVSAIMKFPRSEGFSIT